MATTPAHTIDVAGLRDCGAGPVVTPGDSGWDGARQAWNLAVDQRPAAVAHPRDADDVAAIVRFAGHSGLRVAPQATGHNAGPLGALDSTILLRTSAMGGVEIDPVRRIARVGAGVLWQEVLEQAQAHGLTALAGSAHDVGVAGYSLGGGMGWLARAHGLQCNSLTAVELVTADGELVRADAHTEPDLFWALRGGGGSFGVVTALEFRLYPYATVVGGALAWDWSHAGRVLHRWAQWSAAAPDEITTSARIMQLPPLEVIPEPLRGRQLVMIDGAWCGAPEHADAVLAPLRELAPEIDMFGPMPSVALVQIHGDPPEPVPYVSDHAMLGTLPPEAVDTFVAVAGPGSGSTLLMAELRQLGGALARTPAEHGALPMLEADKVLFGVGMAVDQAMAEASAVDARALTAAMAPWANGRAYMNFAEEATDPARAYGAEAHRRLHAIRAEVDPDGLLHANHPVA
ncbi:MAG: FAD-dependent oxidoreductase [Actinomycetota bacterium]|jgi:FAD/FMN-containing dehydrogenase|nr:FAD-dependent oxidoreductase [Actinomycetota bacterium]